MDQQGKRLEARYAYYRRCQEHCRSGEQCKAPAEKGEAVCYAHARQRAMAARRQAERKVVLAAAAAEMSRRARSEVGMADLFTSFNGIQITIATAAQALIEGKVDCKTAGRLLWDLQRMAKLLSVYQRAMARTTKDTKDHKVAAATTKEEQKPILPKICADERGLRSVWAANEREKARIYTKILEFKPDCRWSKGPPSIAKAA